MIKSSLTREKTKLSQDNNSSNSAKADASTNVKGEVEHHATRLFS